MARIYRGRRDRLVQRLNAATDDVVRISPPAGGMQLLLHLDDKHDDNDITRRLAVAGVTARPLSRHFTGKITGQGLFLGFAAWNEQEIDAGAEIIGKVLRAAEQGGDY